MENSPISVSEALNHVQSWLNAKEYDKVIQGCGEILEMEPGNQRALALMKLAEEQRFEEQPKAEEPPVPQADPLSNLQVENNPLKTNPFTEPEEKAPEKRKLFLAMLIPAIAVVLFGGSTIWFLSIKDRAEVIETAITNIPTDRTYLEENEQRIEDLTLMAETLKDYKKEKGAYPSVDEIETVIMESGDFTNLPIDPRNKDVDKSGKEFGYVYAVYDGIAGSNAIYILSALFEDSKGFAYPWTVGESIKNYPSYRDTDEKNVVLLGE